MTNSESGSSGCFSGILRRVLCTGSVPTHPSDQILDSNKVIEPNFPEKKEANKGKVEIPSPSGPGIVARLMGLDSLPETKWVPGDRKPDSVTRSRSVNFAEYLLKFDSSSEAQQNHRRVATSLSFREVPASCYQQRSRDFLVVYLDDNVDEPKEIELKERKCEMGFRENRQGMKQRSHKSKEKEKKREKTVRLMKNNRKENEGIITSKKISKLKDEPRREFRKVKDSKNCNINGAKGFGSVMPCKKSNNGGGNLKPENRKKMAAKQKFTKKRKNKHASKKIEPISECFPENRSYVLDVYDALVQHDQTQSSEDLRPINKSTPTVPCSEEFDQLSAGKKKDNNEAIIRKSETEGYTELLPSLLCRLTEEDMKESNWIGKNVLEFEGFDLKICMEFERLLVDNLLYQLIDELLEIS
ncbi:hypothetical protein FNV43_RR10247 [Rhamnella rubrinervis]|uniref:DUF3741 domain-containing protein n=1 Tax=Rhamnella rubrinervis TaxID=2594499 RepID=A0A8K0HCV8_9ROSA|nr:hypothetical protein FNV43_RR10247 [Rhamnella rubrinervis]